MARFISPVNQGQTFSLDDSLGIQVQYPPPLSVHFVIRDAVLQHVKLFWLRCSLINTDVPTVRSVLGTDFIFILKDWVLLVDKCFLADFKDSWQFAHNCILLHTIWIRYMSDIFLELLWIFLFFPWSTLSLWGVRVGLISYAEFCCYYKIYTIV